MALVTRASTIRTAIAAAIVATNPDVRARRGDGFKHLDAGAALAESAPDRTFQLQLTAQPQRVQKSVGCDLFVVEYGLTFFYASTQDGIEDRIASDTERMWQPVERLFETVTGVARVDLSPLGIQEPGDGVVTSSFSVVVTYQLDAAVITG